MRRNRSIRWKWLAALSALLVVVTFAAPAEAFYWYGWPGGPRPPKTVVPPDTPGNPPENPPTETPPENPPTSAVPEPATAVAALIGLGALAISRACRRKGASDRGPVTP